MRKAYRKLLAALLVLALCLCLPGCGGELEILDVTHPSETENIRTEETTAPLQSSICPVLYKVTDQDGHRLWLFGSIHVGTEEFYPLPQYVMDAYHSSDALAVEIDILAVGSDIWGQMELVQQLMYTDGSTISQHIPAETYEKAVAILRENHLYAPTLDSFIPAMWWSTIESLTYEKLGARSEYGIDLNMLQMAQKDDKEILEVESAEFQYGIMAEFSEPLQAMLLQSAVESYENLSQTTAECEQLLEIWSAGDADAFAQYLLTDDTPQSEEQQLLNQEYIEKMITSRNLSMTEYAKSALLSGKEIFLCVGAAHIIGEGAIAENLRQKGFIVEQVQ